MGKKGELTMQEKIKKVLAEKVAPLLAAHEGGIELVELKEGIAYVKLLGNCMHCISAEDTMEAIVREILLQEVPGLKDVRAVEAINPELLDFAKKILKKE